MPKDGYNYRGQDLLYVRALKEVLRITDVHSYDEAETRTQEFCYELYRDILHFCAYRSLPTIAPVMHDITEALARTPGVPGGWPGSLQQLRDYFEARPDVKACPRPLYTQAARDQRDSDTAQLMVESTVLVGPRPAGWDRYWVVGVSRKPGHLRCRRIQACGWINKTIELFHVRHCAIHSGRRTR